MANALSPPASPDALAETTAGWRVCVNRVTVRGGGLVRNLKRSPVERRTLEGGAPRDHAAVAAIRIGDLARSCGVTVRALRHYEAEGLFHSRRTRQGERLFTPNQSDIAHLVVQLRRLDVAIADIRAFIDDTVPEPIRLMTLRQTLEHQAADLSSRLASLRRFLDGEGAPARLERAKRASRPVRARGFG
ncbi:MerR family transcriptional regulator [uncultured Brevundimonas sp.]|uniref:MerR family transcriptional regulator n=1 Tax=uncultured Brevundimonas sp. TaxID=213418 RepID=UPI0025D16448|nr:MerR family transcriptional regulator [uncultured Brevundimonas sp.]